MHTTWSSRTDAPGGTQCWYEQAGARIADAIGQRLLDERCATFIAMTYRRVAAAAESSDAVLHENATHVRRLRRLPVNEARHEPDRAQTAGVAIDAFVADPRAAHCDIRARWMHVAPIAGTAATSEPTVPSTPTAVANKDEPFAYASGGGARLSVAPYRRPCTFRGIRHR